MKAVHVNALIDSYRVITESALRVEPRKGDVFAKETFKTDKPFVLFISFEGDIDGFFAIGISEELTLKIVEQMTGGASVPKTIDAMTISCITEFVSMIKGNLIKRFDESKIDCKIQRADFILAEEIPKIEDTVLTVVARSDIGDFELNMLLKTK